LHGVLTAIADGGFGPPPPFFAVKMFSGSVLSVIKTLSEDEKTNTATAAAAAKNNSGSASQTCTVARFMKRNGFDSKLGPLSSLLFELVTSFIANETSTNSSATSDEGGGEGGAPPVSISLSTSELVAREVREKKCVESICFLVVECSFDASEMRKGDCKTVLHLATEGKENERMKECT
jgi:hypothetical protein